HFKGVTADRQPAVDRRTRARAEHASIQTALEATGLRRREAEGRRRTGRGEGRRTGDARVRRRAVDRVGPYKMVHAERPEFRFRLDPKIERKLPRVVEVMLGGRDWNRFGRDRGCYDPTENTIPSTDHFVLRRTIPRKQAEVCVRAEAR